MQKHAMVNGVDLMQLAGELTSAYLHLRAGELFHSIGGILVGAKKYIYMCKWDCKFVFYEKILKKDCHL